MRKTTHTKGYQMTTEDKPPRRFMRRYYKHMFEVARLTQRVAKIYGVDTEDHRAVLRSVYRAIDDGKLKRNTKIMQCINTIKGAIQDSDEIDRRRRIEQEKEFTGQEAPQSIEYYEVK